MFASFTKSYFCLASILVVNVLLAIVSRVGLKDYLRRILFPFPLFVMIIYVPLYINVSLFPLGVSIKFSALLDALVLSLRVATSISLVLLFMLTTTFSEFSIALRRIKIPKRFITTIYFTFLYINLFIREALRLVIARKSRWFGGTYRNFLRVFSPAVGYLFLRGFERGEMLWLGLKSRSYNPDFLSNVNYTNYSFLKCFFLYLIYVGILVLFALSHTECGFIGII